MKSRASPSIDTGKSKILKNKGEIMKSFKEIFVDEAMIMPNAFGISRVQRSNLDESVSFVLDEDSRVFLRNKLPLAGKVYEPTLKKIAENVIILNRKKHRKTDVSKLTLMNKQHYRGYPDSSFYTSTLN